MRGAEAFDGVALLGLAKRSKRDPLRLALLADHLQAAERPLALLTVHGGTLIVTDSRLLQLRAHLEAKGAWNVKEFRGYEVRSETDRAAIRDVDHRLSPPTPAGNVEDALLLHLDGRTEKIVVSAGPEPTLSSEDFETLRRAIFGQAK